MNGHNMPILMHNANNILTTVSQFVSGYFQVVNLSTQQMKMTPYNTTLMLKTSMEV